MKTEEKMKNIELMRKAIREHDNDLIEKLKNEENWTEQEICHEIGFELVTSLKKLGLVYEMDELEEMLGDDGYDDED